MHKQLQKSNNTYVSFTYFCYLFYYFSNLLYFLLETYYTFIIFKLHNEK